VIFTSAAGKLGLAHDDGMSNVSLVKDNGDGTAVYAIDLSK
jgi:2',3'-cyclic-nucleotide 2'-phosphodiesterase/3'-nucleotidase